jgi:rhodanese-related sulfurtransferase
MLVLSLGMFLSNSVLAIDFDKIPEQKKVSNNHYLTTQDVFLEVNKNKSKTLFLDVRTPQELQFVGYTELIDANIPYLTYDYAEWDAKHNEYQRNTNSNFPLKVEEELAKKGLDKNAKIIVMCRSGDRSAKAVDVLTKLGYTNAWSYIEGFEGDKSKKGKRSVNGWKNDNLPWTYNLKKEKMYYLE